MKKLLSALLLTIGIVSLTGCGEGSSSSSNSSTTGSTQFYVSNNDKVNYARVDIEDNSGNIQSSTPIYCPAQSGCNFKANMPAAGSLLFYDTNNTMVNAYILVDPPNHTAFVTTSKDMLGIYLLSAYDNFTPDIDILIDGVRLLNFFQNYAKTGLDSDIPNDLGFYYQSQVIGTGLSYKDFISNLNAQLQNGAVLAPNLFAKNDLSLFNQFLAFFKNTPIIKSAYAADNNITCSPKFQQSAKFAGALPKSFTDKSLSGTIFAASASLVPPPMGGIINLALPIIESACKKPDGTMAAIQALSLKIEELQTTLNTGNLKLDYVLNLVANNTTNTALSTMKDKSGVLKDYVNLYQTILIGDQNGNAAQPKYSNLSDFVAKNGGSVQAAFNNDVKFQTLLDDLNKNYWSSYKILIGQNKSDFATALQAICVADNNGKSSTQDMVQQRIACNGRIALWKNYITAASGQASYLISDLFTMLDAYPGDSQFIQQKTQLLKLDNQSSSSWMDNYSNYAISQVISPALDNTITGFANSNAPLDDPNSGFFLMTDGLPADLITNLKSLKCTNPEDGSVSIIQAFLNGNNTNPVSNIVVVCPNGNGTSLSASKYYYLKDGNNIRNVLGVVVPIDDTAKFERFTFTGAYGPDSKIVINKAQNLIVPKDIYGYTGFLSLDRLPITDVAVINYDSSNMWEMPRNINYFFAYTDKDPLRLSWAWLARARSAAYSAGRAETEYGITCLSSTCAVGSNTHSIGFNGTSKAGGPDPVRLSGGINGKVYWNINGVDANVTASLAKLYGN